MLFNIKKSRSGKIFLSILILSSLLFLVGCVRAPCRGWSGPVVSDGILYVGTIGGKVIALDASTGEKLSWEKELEGKGAGGFGCSSQVSKPMSTYGTPCVENGVVYLGGYDGNVYAFNIEGGMWNKFETGSAIVGSLVIDGTTIFVGNSDGKLYALNLDLSPKWAEPFKIGGKIWSTPAVDNGVVYIGSSDHKLYAIDAESGKEIWHFEAEAGIFSTPLVSEGTVYIGACDNKFYAIEAATEEQKLSARGEGYTAPAQPAKGVFEGAKSWFWTKALAYNGKIYVGNLDHKIYVLDAQNIANEIVEFEYETGGMVRTPPVLVKVNGVKDMIIIGSEDGNIYAFDTENNSWDTLRSLGAPILASIYPDTENGVIYVHAQDGEHMLYAINMETGLDIWPPYKTSE